MGRPEGILGRGRQEEKRRKVKERTSGTKQLRYYVHHRCASLLHKNACILLAMRRVVIATDIPSAAHR